MKRVRLALFIGVVAAIAACTDNPTDPEEGPDLDRFGRGSDAVTMGRPHAVGLQEVSEIDIDLSALGLPVVIDIDFLSILQEALTGRGQEHRSGPRSRH